MSDMFRNYDYPQVNSIKKQSSKKEPADEVSFNATWLYNIKGDLLGLKANGNSGFTFYVNIEIEDDSALLDYYFENHTFTCEFLDKAFETVLSVPAIPDFTGVLKISVDPGVLSTGTYYLKIAATELIKKQPDLEISDSVSVDVPEGACLYLCPICGGCKLDKCILETDDTQESEDNNIGEEEIEGNLSIDDDSVSFEVPEEPEDPVFCTARDKKCTCSDVPTDDVVDEPVIELEPKTDILYSSKDFVVYIFGGKR